MYDESFLRRYNNYIIKQEGCWDWRGSLNTKGYPYLRSKGHNLAIHRFAYTRANGDIPEKLLICHTCNNPRCTNPDHLYLGTYSDNTNQAVRDGRHRPPKGATHPFAKLTDEDVRLIRMDGRYQKVIAASFGIRQSAVSKIKNYKMRKEA